jgi:hypothetical protein
MDKPDAAVWKVQTQTGVDGLVFEEDIATSNNIGGHDCLVAIEASSLNYRDIMIGNVRDAECLIHNEPLIQLCRAHTLSLYPSQSPQAQMHPAQSSPSAQKSHASASATMSAHTSCRLIWTAHSPRRNSKSASEVVMTARFARQASSPNRRSCACPRR